ncbi:MAG TPA: CheR family methyltransferase [Kofleriaceae bacterium]|nr:CheR family methyltransferase [Kofleriaceae bacterium]
MASSDPTSGRSGDESDKAEEDRPLENLLDFIRSSRGIDFTGYKRTSLRRRIASRARTLGVGDDLGLYRDHLKDHPEELSVLLDTIFINITSFFRDPDAWAYVGQEVIPRILRAKPPDAPIRLWSAGCASGEEPFSAAMLLAEALGLEEYNRRVKIYATDWDEGALVQARKARYPTDSLETVPDELRQKYFLTQDGTATLHNSLRRVVIFGQHDLVEDAPISRVDLLLCRNTIMYFNVDTQARVLARLHFSLEDSGYLFLGRAEMLLSRSQAFTPIELRHRIFAKAPAGPGWTDRRGALSPVSRRRDEDPARNARLREAALEASPVAQVVLDPTGRIGVINHKAILLFNLSSSDLGKPIQDLELSYRPADLRSMMDEALASRLPVHRQNVEYKDGRGGLYLDVAVAPILRNGLLVATAITFTDVSHHHKLQENLQRFSENLETAYEELQSANEELETTNEELQAANEEMETINEELRSANEELEGANQALRMHEGELNQANGFLNAVLSSLRAGLAVLNEDLIVGAWNDLAVEMWGLRAEEVVGRAFVALDIGLPVGDLIGPIRAFIAQPNGKNESRDLIMKAVNRRGRSFDCRLVISRLAPDGERGKGVCILMEDLTARAGESRQGEW